MLILTLFSVALVLLLLLLAAVAITASIPSHRAAAAVESRAPYGHPDLSRRLLVTPEGRPFLAPAFDGDASICPPGVRAPVRRRAA